MSRVYAPLNLAMFNQLTSGGRVLAPHAFTVTPALREALGGFDEEELEHLATQLAASACSTRPIAVVALDVALPRVELVSEVLAGCQVAEVGMKDVVCFFTSDDEVNDDADLELSWYDASEINAVRAVLAPQ